MTTRRPLVAGNWKMNPTDRTEALSLAGASLAVGEAHPDVDVLICPPTIWLSDIAQLPGASPDLIGAQTMAAQEHGAFTGETSPLMLAGLAGWVILGHSERRRYDGETDESVGRKVASAVAHGLRPIAAVGELLAEREAGETEAVIARQLHAAIERLEKIAGSGLVIAYEPVWAIGTGRAASPEDAQAAARQIRGILAERDPHGAIETRILYGGSVTDENAAPFFAQPDVDGALVGGACLEATRLAGIIDAAETEARA
ncbi:MAG TPA: triose-phosphate isomerase [Candidatus Limnocylindria bacterium]|nr:triose-phosphate isomerase [Candidatus Limnocylindria bacterium]